MRFRWESENRIGFPGSRHRGFSRLFEPVFAVRYALSIRSGSCMMSTQHLIPRDSNSTRILFPLKLPLGARRRLSLKNWDSGETFREKLGLGLRLRTV